MSNKAQALVWDMECPCEYSGLIFKPNHKYVLVAYADHADHLGKNIYPAVHTVSRKTGYKVRNVQYLTHELEQMGILVPDGYGPRGTNKWRIPYDAGGAKIAPVQTLQGAKSVKSLGAKPSGANFAPESTEPIYIDTERYGNELGSKNWQTFLNQIQMEMKKAIFNEHLGQPWAARLIDNTIYVVVQDPDNRDWLDARIKRTAERVLIGIMAQDVNVQFIALDPAGTE
jgi:hypothetical protein